MEKKHIAILLCVIVISTSVILVYPSSRKQGFTSGVNWIKHADEYAAEYNPTKPDYQGTPVPLSDSQMFFFQDNQFKPECCPSSYSSGSGCACISSEQIKYLNERGGNRTMP